jgi:hypothetical protein
MNAGTDNNESRRRQVRCQSCIFPRIWKSAVPRWYQPGNIRILIKTETQHHDQDQLHVPRLVYLLGTLPCNRDLLPQPQRPVPLQVSPVHPVRLHPPLEHASLRHLVLEIAKPHMLVGHSTPELPLVGRAPQPVHALVLLPNLRVLVEFHGPGPCKASEPLEVPRLRIVSKRM